MPFVAMLLFGASVLAALLGLVQLTQATAGVGLVAFACYLGIVARLAQATGHFENHRAWFHQWKKAVAPTEPRTESVVARAERERKTTQVTRLVLVGMAVALIVSIVAVATWRP